MLDFYRFMVAVARVSVNHDGKGGTAPGVQGGRPKARKLDIRVNVDLASLLGSRLLRRALVSGSWCPLSRSSTFLSGRRG